MIARHPLFYCAAVGLVVSLPVAGVEYILDEVVVTARHREENLQQTPVTVSVFSSDSLFEQGTNNLGDLQHKVPNSAIFASRGTSSTLTAYIRGIGQDDPLWGYEPGVGLYIDDVYIARPQGALLDIYDVERIEVLRGPQGTLYGKNTLGGAIKYITHRLPSDSIHGSIEGRLGDYQHRDGLVSVGGPLTDTFRAGIAVASYYRGGFGTNETSGRDVSNKEVLSGRISTEWLISEDWQLLWNADVTKDDSNVRGAQRLTDSVLTAEPPLDNPHDVRSNLSDSNYVKTSGTAATLIGQLTDALQLRSITAYRDGRTDTNIDFDTLAVSVFDVPAWYDDDQFSEEIRLNIDQDRWHSVVGLYYLDSDACGSFDVAIGVANTLQTISGCIETRSTAIFGHTSFAVTDRINISAGLRYNRDDKDASVFQAATVNGTSVTSTDFSNDEQWSHLSPKLGIDVQLDTDLLVFASVSEGFKSGGFNMRANAARESSIGRDASQPFGEETLETAELGIKSQWLDHRITANATLFYSRYDEIQITTSRFYDSNGDGVADRSFTQVDNAGKADLSGAEIDLSVAATRRWRVNADIGYLEADLERLTEFDRTTGRAFNDADNRHLQNTPRWTVGIENAFDIHQGENGSLTLLVNCHHRSEYYPEVLNSELIKQGAYNLWDLSLVHQRTDIPVTLALHALNVTDKEYRVAGYNFENVGGERVITGFYGDPRTLTASARYQW
jgi:iron complex outermembrane receptor protein